MADARAEAIHRISAAITKILMKDGRLIEIGFRLFVLRSYSTGVPETAGIPIDMAKEQYDQLRCAFFAGAQHLFGSLTNGLDPDAEPTADDMRKMELISSELDAFIDDFKRQHGMDLGERATRQ